MNAICIGIPDVASESTDGSSCESPLPPLISEAAENTPLVQVYEYAVCPKDTPAKNAIKFLAIDTADAYAQYFKHPSVNIHREKVVKHTLTSVKLRGPFMAKFNDDKRCYEIVE